MQVPVKMKANTGSKNVDFAKKKEHEALSTNYLASIDFIFEAAKKKRSILDSAKND